MSGCPNLGLPLERIQCLDKSPLPSLIKKLNISYCNLFDNSFPNDWSNLVSLKELDISGNNVTSLPKCIQTLPRIEVLVVERCSEIQSVQGVPKSVSKLYLEESKSLERVQLAENSMATVSHLDCSKLCDMGGRYKSQSIEKVERKIIRYLGLESIAAVGMDISGLKVLFEYGIFSTIVSENQIPSCSRFTHKERGRQISFEVPSHHNSSRIMAFNMCVVCSGSKQLFLWISHVYHKTKKLSWIYITRNVEDPTNMEKWAWLSLWRCGDLLEGGDEILIQIIDDDDENKREVEECCIKLVYEDDELYFKSNEAYDDGARKNAHPVNVFDQFSWTDRTNIDISDYVHTGMMYQFPTHLVLGVLWNQNSVNWFRAQSTQCCSKSGIDSHDL